MLLDMANEGDTIITLVVSLLSISTQQWCEFVDSIRRKYLWLMIVGSITVEGRNGKTEPESEAFLQLAENIRQLKLGMMRTNAKG